MKERNLADRCLEQEQLDTVLRDGPDEDQQAHLEACAACRSLVASYRTFQADDPLPAGADMKAATARLDDFVDGLTGEAAEPAAETAVAGTIVPRWWNNPAWRPALAALLVVAVGGLWWLSGDGDEALRPSGVLRDGMVDSAADFAVIATARTGGWDLRWTTAPGADGYRVRVLDASLREILLLEAGPNGTFPLNRADHPTLAGTGLLFASIEALKAGDLMTRTELIELETGEP